MGEQASELPFLTGDIPGTGGQLRTCLEDFRVDELPAYEPCGEGDHVMVRIEKRDCTTPDAVALIADALNVRPIDIGWAGMKDRRAITTQWLSLPPPITPEAARALTLPNVAVLEAERHRNKLRTGHLRGNRFAVRLRHLDVPASEAASRAVAVLDRLSKPPGSPNWFGSQRFGVHGDNAAQGRAILRGGRGGPRGRKRRFLLSALQSSMFNQYLALRIHEGLFGRVLEGDVMQKRHSGGIFHSSDPGEDQGRLESGEIVPTGPMFGHSMRQPPEGTVPATLEQSILAAEELSPESFAHVGKLAPGTRRPLAVDIGTCAVHSENDDTIELRFSLPSGAYATALLREVVKGSTPFPR
ncbi:tRNA pseudouridine(13) synthase TruD [Haliangium ochraceum]|uniref:tRNA pseudouridine synthase D n=1 Tax=Haliangium ochraceum (strain DSM 14365 / JCM 11303 / SMP-2) TaxID=502025 RepID=D0LRB0_HALO1|nr:tRNA pseudouridine(13) synthase TruD [Haliangium ochraceum]ACY17138.1 tRNA pseudouridine synthase D TruD [Haliangium ochraceum DSM 14365]